MQVGREGEPGIIPRVSEEIFRRKAVDEGADPLKEYNVLFFCLLPLAMQFIFLRLLTQVRVSSLSVTLFMRM